MNVKMLAWCNIEYRTRSSSPCNLQFPFNSHLSLVQHWCAWKKKEWILSRWRTKRFNKKISRSTSFGAARRTPDSRHLQYTMTIRCFDSGKPTTCVRVVLVGSCRCFVLWRSAASWNVGGMRHHFLVNGSAQLLWLCVAKGELHPQLSWAVSKSGEFQSKKVGRGVIIIGTYYIRRWGSPLNQLVGNLHAPSNLRSQYSIYGNLHRRLSDID